jgi:hypothetical protein
MKMVIQGPTFNANLTFYSRHTTGIHFADKKGSFSHSPFVLLESEDSLASLGFREGGMGYKSLTIQKWNTYTLERTDKEIHIYNASLTPNLNSDNRTSLIISIDGKEPSVICNLKPYECENTMLFCKVGVGKTLKISLSGENDIDLLYYEEEK